MFLSDLQKKDIIKLDTGINLGKIIDAEITENGSIISFTIEPRRFLNRFFRKTESVIEFSSIVKIGSDVILVK